jgi:anaerobic selenocysteine-containing dehydrogenase
MNRLGETLLDAKPPVRALFVYNANPLMTFPDQERVRAGLARDDLFTVVFDQVMTDTARTADVVLPATTFLEHRDLRRGYGSTALQECRPVIAPVGEARSNVEVFAELCRRLGVDGEDEPETAGELASALLASDRRGVELSAALGERGLAEPDCGLTPVQMVDVFPRTSDGKIHLLPGELDREATEGLYAFREDPGSERFPLALVSPATNRTISSTFGQLHRRPVALELDPADAEARDLATGDKVRVWNELGEVRCRLRVSEDLRPGVAFLPKGLWSHHTENGATANALVPATLTDLAGGACFNDARVEVEKV